MPQTPKLGLRYPSPGDRPLGPQAIANLASDIENSPLASPALRILHRTTTFNLPQAEFRYIDGGWTGTEGDFGDQSGILYSGGVAQVSRSGVYVMTVYLHIETASDTRVMIRTLKNGSTFFTYTALKTGSAVPETIGFTDYPRLAMGDTLQLGVWVTGSTPRRILPSGEDRSRWTIEYRYPL